MLRAIRRSDNVAFRHSDIRLKPYQRSAVMPQDGFPILPYICFTVCRNSDAPQRADLRMPNIFAVAYAKGGSGKSIVAILLAGEFSATAIPSRSPVRTCKAPPINSTP